MEELERTAELGSEPRCKLIFVLFDIERYAAFLAGNMERRPENTWHTTLSPLGSRTSKSCGPADAGTFGSSIIHCLGLRLVAICRLRGWTRNIVPAAPRGLLDAAIVLLNPATHEAFNRREFWASTARWRRPNKRPRARRTGPKVRRERSNSPAVSTRMWPKQGAPKTKGPAEGGAK